MKSSDVQARLVEADLIQLTLNEFDLDHNYTMPLYIYIAIAPRSASNLHNNFNNEALESSDFLFNSIIFFLNINLQKNKTNATQKNTFDKNL